MERFRNARRAFEGLNTLGIRPLLYPVQRLAGGEYVSHFTEEAWKHFRSGWIAAGGSEE